MSRDMTPEESLLLEKHMVATHGESHSLWSFLENSVWSYNGSTWPMHTPEQIAQRKQYPMLGKLMNNFDRTYEALSQIPGGLAVLAQADQELQQYVDTGKGDENSLVIQWFEGRLDKHFYYSERNDEYFDEGLYEAARNLTRKAPLQEQISSAEERAANHPSDQEKPAKEPEH